MGTPRTFSTQIQRIQEASTGLNSPPSDILHSFYETRKVDLSEFRSETARKTSSHEKCEEAKHNEANPTSPVLPESMMSNKVSDWSKGTPIRCKARLRPVASICPQHRPRRSKGERRRQNKNGKITYVVYIIKKNLLAMASKRKVWIPALRLLYCKYRRILSYPWSHFLAGMHWHTAKGYKRLPSYCAAPRASGQLSRLSMLIACYQLTNCKQVTIHISFLKYCSEKFKFLPPQFQKL